MIRIWREYGAWRVRFRVGKLVSNHRGPKLWPVLVTARKKRRYERRCQQWYLEQRKAWQ